ncbi:MAG: hypothetical protein ACUVXJ_20110, partial [Phycisphaerae bacterium]
MVVDQPENPFVYPPEWVGLTRDLTGSRTLKVAGYEVVVQITVEQLDFVYLPLLAMLAGHNIGEQ